jgi:hypothetical protein
MLTSFEIVKEIAGGLNSLLVAKVDEGDFVGVCPFRTS